MVVSNRGGLNELTVFSNRAQRRHTRTGIERLVRIRKHRWLAYAAGAASALMALKFALEMGKRRELLRLGVIRELRSSPYDVGGLRMHVRTAGDTDAPAIVLVHGLGVSSSYFVPLAERLAARFRVYSPDLPGHGYSASAAMPLDIAGLAKALLDWMDEAGVERAILVGHSMGAQIAVEASLRSPQRVDQIVLIGLTPEPTARSTTKQFVRFLLGILFERPSLAPLILKDYLHVGSRLGPEFDAMRFDPIERKLPLVTVPSILIRGEDDPMSSQEWLERAARLLKTDCKIVIPSWGHAVMYSDPEDLVNALLPLLTNKGDNRQNLQQS
jgi:2-hydroxy-6-oxonona-2,4-dienedioate hydrolase